MNNKFKAQSLNRKSYRKFTLIWFSVTCFKHVGILWPISALDRKQVRGYIVNGLCQVWLWVRTHEAIAQARDLLFTARRNVVKCVKYICMKLPYVAQQVGNAYFYRLTEIKELSGSLWWMHEGRNLLKPIAGCGLFSHVDPKGVARH